MKLKDYFMSKKPHVSVFDSADSSYGDDSSFGCEAEDPSEQRSTL
jgi:hypothetical protein